MISQKEARWKACRDDNTPGRAFLASPLDRNRHSPRARMDKTLTRLFVRDKMVPHILRRQTLHCMI